MHLRTLALAATTAVLLTGCSAGGGETAASPSPTPTPTADPRTGEEVLEDATTALRESGAFHAQGSMTKDGTEAGVDLQLQDDGAQGTLTLDGQDIEVLIDGDEAYLKAEAGFWQSSGAPDALVQLISGRWMLMPAAEAGELGPLALDGFVKDLLEPESGVEAEVEIGQVDGQDVLIVSTDEGSTLSVLADDDSYPVQITGTTADPGQVDLSGFGERQEITPPTDFIDLAELGG